MDSHIHDEITQNTGSFLKVMNSIKLLKKNQIPITVSCVEMKNNLGQIPKIYHFAKNEGLNVIFDYIITPNFSGSNKPFKYRLDDSELQYSYVASNKGIQKHGINAWLSTIARNHLFIAPNGDAFPNITLRLKAGNVLKESISDIWSKSQELNNIRGWTINDFECGQCKHKNICTSDPGLALSEHSSPFKKPLEVCRYTFERLLNQS